MLHHPIPHPRAVALVLALLLVPAAASCGVATNDQAVKVVDGGDTTTALKTTSTLPACPEGNDTGGAIGTNDDPTACAKPDRVTTTTTEPTPGSGDDEAAYVEAMAASAKASQDLGIPMSDDEATCIGEKWVDTLGVSEIANTGVEPDELASGELSELFGDLIGRGEAKELVSALTDCGLDLERAFAKEIGSASGASKEQVACILDAFPEGYIEKIMAITLADGSGALDSEPGLSDPITEAVNGCP